MWMWDEVLKEVERPHSDYRPLSCMSNLVNLFLGTNLDRIVNRSGRGFHRVVPRSMCSSELITNDLSLCE